MKKHWIVILISLASTAAMGQNAIDALRFSQQSVNGTARFTSMGGAFGALGGDLSAIPYNPGALGVYRRADFSITPAYYTDISQGTLLNSASINTKQNFNFGNIGYVGVSEKDASSALVSTAFAFGYNRMHTFQSRFGTDVVNPSSSLADQYLYEVQSNNIDPAFIYQAAPFGAALAWDTYLLDTVNGQYVSNVPGYGQSQRYTSTTRGRVGETFIGFGGNVDHKLYFGMTVGFTGIRFSQTIVHQETFQQNWTDTLNSLESFEQRDNLDIEGSGFNFKIGAIYRLNKMVRLGGAIHSPTWYNMTDEWDSRMETNFELNQDFVSESPDGAYTYKLRTPARAIGSAALLIGKLGLISAEYEFVDYSWSKLYKGADGYTFSGENNSIDATLGVSNILRVGTEWKLQPVAIRAGMAMYGSPYSGGEKGASTSYSGGLGYRSEDFYVDVAYVLASRKDEHQSYAPGLIEATKLESISHNFLLTLGKRF